ncbi:MAG: hypothetical protein EBS06_02420 [Proteobacteria bacterium]|nr:hypothetical protein [Pseudomonadota bacterium]
MKKAFLIAALSFFAIQNSALAKTEGSYIGIDLLNSKAKFVEKYTNDNNKNEASNTPHHSNSGYGAGLHYNYAINFGGLFISPGVLLEQNNVKVNGYSNNTIDIDSQRLQIKNRYGIKSDIGYDFTDKFSVYATGGYAYISYRTKDYSDLDGKVTGIKNGIGGSWFYGAGIKIDCDKTSSVNLEFNTQNFSAKTKIINSYLNLSARYQTRLDVVKVGYSYRF